VIWRRLRRRTLAPNRPVVWPEQYALVALTLLALAAGIAVVVWLLTA
jgi:hypothetical protein